MGDRKYCMGTKGNAGRDGSSRKVGKTPANEKAPKTFVLEAL